VVFKFSHQQDGILVGKEEFYFFFRRVREREGKEEYTRVIRTSERERNVYVIGNIQENREIISVQYSSSALFHIKRKRNP
jgi:hypothetical protein